MTSMLERTYETPTPLADALLSPEIDALPVLDTTDGCATGQGLNKAVKVLIVAAREAGIPCDNDNLYVIGNPRGKHIAVGREVGANQAGTMANVNIIEFADPLNNTHTRYKGSEVPAEGKTIVDFRVDEERYTNSRAAIFSGSNGAELSDDASRLARQLALDFLDVAAEQLQQGVLSREALEEIVVPLTTIEAAADKRINKKIGGGAVSRLLSRVGIHHAAA